MTEREPHSPAFTARAEGKTLAERVAVARVTHAFAPGWVASRVKRRSVTGSGTVRFPPHAGQPQPNKPDLDRCRICGRPAAAVQHGPLADTGDDG